MTQKIRPSLLLFALKLLLATAIVFGHSMPLLGAMPAPAKGKPKAFIRKMARKNGLFCVKVCPDTLVTKGLHIPLTYQIKWPEPYFDKRAGVKIESWLSNGTDSLALDAFVIYAGSGSLDNEDENIRAYSLYKEYEYSEVWSKSGVFFRMVFFDRSQYKHPESYDFSKDNSCIFSGSVRIAESSKNSSILIVEDEKLKEAGISKNYNAFRTFYQRYYFPVSESDMEKAKKYEYDNNPLIHQNEMPAFLRNCGKMEFIRIYAYASPEGNKRKNKQLSDKRGQRLKEELINNIKSLDNKKLINRMCGASHVVILDQYANGSDWQGLDSLLDVYKIHSPVKFYSLQYTEAEKQRKLNKLRAKHPVIDKEVFPLLRRSEILMRCNKFPDTSTKLLDFIASHHEILSADDLLYAANISKDEKDKLAILKIMEEHYPQDWRAYNNQAVTLLKNHEISKAISVIEKAFSFKMQSPILINTAAVAYSRAGDFNKAAIYYGQLEEAMSDVNYNLGLMYLKKGDYQKASELLNITKASFNKALAQFLSNDLPQSLKTLEKFKKDARAYYLKALIYVKWNKRMEVLENLKEGIRLNRGFYEKVKNDLDFTSFLTKEELKNL